MIDNDDHEQILADPNATTDELRSIIAELQAVSIAIGTTVYMDPPDGGSPTLAEQIARMAKDAARYRWLRDVRSVTIDTMLHGNGCRARSADELDTAIDAAMARKS